MNAAAFDGHDWRNDGRLEFGNCPRCGVSRSTAIFESPDRQYQAPELFYASRCVGCGLLFQNSHIRPEAPPKHYKQGKFSPGADIPVRPHCEFAQRPPDYALLFAWNHGTEIMAKEQAFTAAEGKWITYVPCVEVSK